MDEQRRAKFEALMNDTREDILRIEAQIDKELAEVKARLAGLQNEKKAQLTIYGGYCQLLDIPNEFEEEGDAEEEI